MAAAKNDAFCLVSAMFASTWPLSNRMPGLSQADWLQESSPKGGEPWEAHQRAWNTSTKESAGHGQLDKMEACRGRVLSADAKKAESASEDTLLTPRPPSFIGRVAWSHCVSVRSEFIIIIIIIITVSGE